MTFEKRVEEFREACRVFLIACGFVKLADWLVHKLRREERD
ncbi:hypothetical protein PghCCS26_47570 [Paenibacillus glycanilyticus]|uniref:Uncharacterized protein n=1 Tax=Paenibacillus glycanilyticus TaxID=126569 RepID=A0ABQ6NU13_9BACL|nr:hypothetical protein PghCCS26_47570 [Paenibacillus glycanilyticus]